MAQTTTPRPLTGLTTNVPLAITLTPVRPHSIPLKLDLEPAKHRPEAVLFADVVGARACAERDMVAWGRRVERDGECKGKGKG